MEAESGLSRLGRIFLEDFIRDAVWRGRPYRDLGIRMHLFIEEFHPFRGWKLKYECKCKDIGMYIWELL